MSKKTLNPTKLTIKYLCIFTVLCAQATSLSVFCSDVITREGACSLCNLELIEIDTRRLWATLMACYRTSVERILNLEPIFGYPCSQPHRLRLLHNHAPQSYPSLQAKRSVALVLSVVPFNFDRHDVELDGP